MATIHTGKEELNKIIQKYEKAHAYDENDPNQKVIKEFREHTEQIEIKDPDIEEEEPKLKIIPKKVK